MSVKQSTFGQRIQELMKPGETQQQFGERVGINRNTIATYVKKGNENRIPETEIVLRISRSCHVSADWLLGITDVRSPEPDIQAAHELTKLSEKAISNIIELSEYPAALAGLDYMLRNRDELQGVAQSVYDYRNAIQKPEIIPLGKSDNHISGITTDVATKLLAILQFESLIKKVGES